MLQSIVGPPMVGTTGLRSPTEQSVDKGFKGSRQDSAFGKTLEDKMSSKSPKDEVKESPQRGMRQKEKDEKPQESNEKMEPTVGQPSTKKATVRQQAIQEFMDSFESEFQISPTRLVEAMAELNDNQLVQSPEDTAGAVVSQLGLDESDTEKAIAMYSALLLQLQHLPQQQQPKPVSEMMTGTGLSTQQQMQERVAFAQGRQNVMATSVESLNKKFWMTQEPKALPTAMPDLMMEDIPMDTPEMAPSEVVTVEKKPSLEALPPHLQGQMKEAISPALLAALAAKQAASSGGESTELSEEAPALMDEFQQVLQTPKAPPAMPVNQAQGKISQDFFQNQSQGQSLMQQQSQGYAQQGPAVKKDTGSKISESGTEFKQSLTGLEGMQGAPIKGEVLRPEAVVPMAAATQGAPLSPSENEAAVKQIMNQAQYLIKKGGGEMKVQMTPEGLGTIHLKVMLQDGKVNMQMSADTQEAKKTIESSLAELKTSLAAQKLSMENVKVDVINSTSADTATQNQTNMNGQNQRDQARQYWNQFNENFGSQGRRESFAEMPNLKGYGNRERNPLQPIEGSSKSRVRSVEGKGSGLNLVA